MKTYIPNPDNVHGSNNSISQLDDNSEGEIVSTSEEEGSEEMQVTFSSPSSESDDILVDPNHIMFSVSSWLHSFTLCMPETYIISIPPAISKMMSENRNIINILTAPEMGRFSQQLNTAIAKVGGTAFIKNNWHAPKDAAMFSLNHLLKVHNVHDILNFMIYSDTIMNDFDRELGGWPFCVAVRPWMDIHPATEFRCIVVHNELVGITPREWPKYYAHFKDIMPALIESISNLFSLHIKSFPAVHYTFDVIYTSFDNVQLWDFGPLNSSSKLYAFMWDEIKSIIEGSPAPNRPPVFRYLVEDCGILPQNPAYQQQHN